MTKYLLHKDLAGNPIGVWNEQGDNYYPASTDLKKSAENLMYTRMEGEPWDEFSDRLSSRVSHRDWWEVLDSSKSTPEEAWIEVDPSSEPLF